MSERNYLHCGALTKMRQEMLQMQKERRHYQSMYQAECRDNKKLKLQLLRTQKMNSILTAEMEKEKRMQPNNPSNEVPTVKKTRKRKRWQDIKNEGTKRRRLNFYKDMLIETLKQMDSCKKAQVTLWICEQKVHFTWSNDDFNNSTNDSSQQISSNVRNIYHEHTYGWYPKPSREEAKDFNDTDLSEIFESSGHWRKIHLRRLIHVLDSYRISHEGYHELRMVSKGHLPPISKITREKTIMSEEIPYTKHPTVSK